MSKVRIFGYSGTKQLAQGVPRHFNSDSVFVREEPYLWSQVITLNGATPVESQVQPNDTAKILVIEVPDSVTVRYEINPNGPAPATTHRDAGDGSPRLNGIDLFEWFRGATVSFVDGANFP